jgi:hypothetical protein
VLLLEKEDENDRKWPRIFGALTRTDSNQTHQSISNCGSEESSLLGGIVAQVITISIYTPASGVELGKQRADWNTHKNKSLSNHIKQKICNTQPQALPLLACLLD